MLLVLLVPSPKKNGHTFIAVQFKSCASQAALREALVFEGYFKKMRISKTERPTHHAGAGTWRRLASNSAKTKKCMCVHQSIQGDTAREKTPKS